jgi:hypothetical protein
MSIGVIDRLRAGRGARERRVAAEPPAVDPAAAPDPGELSSLESRIVWIWGSPRSGSTWLLQLLADPLDPDPEDQLGFRLPEALPSAGVDAIPVDETFISNHLAPALGDPRIVEGRWVPGTINNLLAPKPTYAFSDEYREVWEPAARQFILIRLEGALARARAAGVELDPAFRMVIKETNGSHAADIVMRVLPASRILLLIRDGRDVVDSLLSAYQPGGFMANKQGRAFTTEDERANGLRWAARLWACNTDMTLKAIESHPPELVRIVRYEDLLDSGVGELESVFSWLELRRQRKWIEALLEKRSFKRIPKKQTGPLTRNRSATPGLWRDNLSAEEQGVVNEICWPLLERFGYEL